MQRTLFYRIGMIILLGILLMVPLGMIRGVVSERQEYRQQAYTDIANSLARSQMILGPVLVVPYDKITRYTYEDPQTSKPAQRSVKERRYLYLLPEQLSLQADAKISELKRGIYSIPAYHSAMAVKGHFAIQEHFGLKESLADITWGEPFLWVGLSDNRGIENRPVLRWQGQTISFSTGESEAIPLKSFFHGSISAPLGKRFTGNGNYHFSFDLDLMGTNRLDWVPSAKAMTVTLQSN